MEHAEDRKEIVRLTNVGHSIHCAQRIVWGDGECECGIAPYRLRFSGSARWNKLVRFRTTIEGVKTMSREKDLQAANVQACAYNAAVNYGSERGHKKMIQLIDALNSKMRFDGKEAMDHLVAAGVIEAYNPCPPECGMRPGGLFHAEHCENEPNHPVYRARVQAATEKLPGGQDGHEGWRAATVSLVGI